MNIKSCIFSVLLFGVISCKQADTKVTGADNESTAAEQTAEPFIKPPVKGVDVPYKEYAVNAAKGDTLFYKSGSIIVFPPNSFVDKDGIIVKGDVWIKYREFSNPMDFYLAGMPMNYDSAGRSYSLESSGMGELLAFKDGVPVFVNPESKPEINLASKNISPAHSIYYLDTVQKKWINQGESIVTVFENPVSKSLPKKVPAVNKDINELPVPLKPEKANGKSPVIQLLIDSSSFHELSAYHNLRFQLDVNEKGFSPKDTTVEWSNVRLIKGESDGLYTVKLSSPSRTVYYKARPVFEGKDYDEALIIFREKQLEYEKLKKEREARELRASGKYIVDTLEYGKLKVQNKKNEKLNRLIEARNREIKKQNEVLSAINESSNNFRTFAVDRFGIWNADLAIVQSLIQITAIFADKNGGIELTDIAVFCKSVNSIMRFRTNNIGVVSSRDNMIVGAVNGELAYISYADYSKLGIDANTKEQTFLMTVLSGKENNYEQIKAISGGQ